MHQANKIYQRRSQGFEIPHFFVSFQDGSRAAILDFKKYTKNIGRPDPEGQEASPCQISSKSVRALQRHNYFSILQDGGRCLLDFHNYQTFSLVGSEGPR